MKSKIINVSFSSKFNNLSYPIFVGVNLLNDSGEILKNFIQNKKIIIIHDDYFFLIKIKIKTL